MALLSPYWGGNLGDGAILQAVIHNIRALNSNVEFVSVTLRPEGMRRHHGVTGITLVSYRRYYYSDTAPQSNTAGVHRTDDEHGGLSLMRRIKLYAAERFPVAYGIAQCIRTVILAVPSEMRHFFHALRFLRQSDVLVVAGGGQLDDEWGGAWGHPYALFKWTCAARLMGRPVVFLSVGVARLDSRLSRWFVARSLGLAAMVSLRDQWSKLFAVTNLKQRTCSLAPDLAFSLPVQVPGQQARPAGSLTIGVSPIAYGQRNVWPTVAQATSDRYLQVLGSFVEHLLAAGHAIVLFHTDEPDKEVVARIVDSVRSKAQGADLSRLRVARTDSLPELLAVLPTLDAVVASRLHGIILSHVHAIPSLAISYDRKVTTHMAQVGQSDLCLALEDLRLEVLVERFATLQSRRLAMHQVLAALAERWRHELLVQYQKTLALVTGNPSADQPSVIVE